MHYHLHDKMQQTCYKLFSKDIDYTVYTLSTFHGKTSSRSSGLFQTLKIKRI